MFKELVGSLRENKSPPNPDCPAILVPVPVGSVWTEPENPLKSKVDGTVSPDREKLPAPPSVKVVRGGDTIGRGGPAPRKPGSPRGGGSSLGKPGGGGPNPRNKGGRPKPRSPKGVNPCCNEDLTNKTKITKGRLSRVVFRRSMVLGTSSL